MFYGGMKEVAAEEGEIERQEEKKS